MTRPVTSEELQAQIDLRRERFRQVVSEIRAVLVEDLATYPARHTKAAFLAKPAVAEGLDAGQVKALKAAAEALGKDASKRVDHALSSEGPWLEGNADEPGEARSLASNPAVWSHVSAVDDALHELLAQYGLAEDAAPVYKAPAYFVGGRYFPALAEHYWKTLAEITELSAQKEAVDASAQRERLQKLWDDA